MARNSILVLAGGLLAILALAAPATADGADSLRLTGGRLVLSSSPTTTVEKGTNATYGVTYDAVGSSDATFSGPGGLVLRALSGARVRADRGADGGFVLTVERGSIADAAAALPFDVVTPAARIRSEGARFSLRAIAEGAYVEHRQGSPGRLVVTPYGGAGQPLAAGSFRMVGLTAATTSAPVASPAARPASIPVPPPAGPSTGLAAPTRIIATAGLPAPRVIPASLVADVPVEGVPPTATSDAAAPVPMHPCSPNCGRMLRTPPPAVPVRADDYGRVPLGTAMPGGPCCNRADVECNRVPYVRYVEGLVCDVATYKLGYRLVTVRPASRVRVHRLPDGSLQLWAPNIGKDLALIELDWNQFCFIGEDGFLVLSADGQVEYFRGLVHLWHHRGDEECLFKTCRPTLRQVLSGQQERACE